MSAPWPPSLSATHDWHSADPTMKAFVLAEADHRGITVRELLDEVLSDYRSRMTADA